MRLAYIADGRSPIAVQWIENFIQQGHQVHLISTFPCHPELDLGSIAFVPVAFSWYRRRALRPAKMDSRITTGNSRALQFRTLLRHWLGPATVRLAARQARTILEHIQPDLVHALRIPFEGMLAAVANPSAPLILTVWGNDFTLHAPASPGMTHLTRKALSRADALHTDCGRDLQLARIYGFPTSRPEIILPGNGGLKPEIFYPGEPQFPADSPITEALASLPKSAPVVVNPRGFRAYVRNDTFFQAIPHVLSARPETRFLCPAMAGDLQAERWLQRLKITESVSLLPRLTSMEMADLFRRAQITVSPSEHDGTPNTLLEAMACGCFPIAGDLDSIREWIHGELNGLLIDPSDPKALSNAILRALHDEPLRETAIQHNLSLIAERATRAHVMQQAGAFYHQVIGKVDNHS